MALIQITAGRGPLECSLVVGLISDEIYKESKKLGLQFNIVSKEKDKKDKTYKSIFIEVTGDLEDEFVKNWIGTIKYTLKSPFRPHHKRKNWFVGTSIIKTIDPQNINPKEVVFDTLRSSGPGGQHANKTESAVRATHVPSGLSVTISEERSQYRNKKLAVSILMDKVLSKTQKKINKNEKEIWGNHNSIERGNPVRVLKG